MRVNGMNGVIVGGANEPRCGARYLPMFAAPHCLRQSPAIRPIFEGKTAVIHG